MINSYEEVYSSASPIGGNPLKYKLLPLPPSIPYRLSSFQHTLDPFQRFLFTAKTQKSLSFQVENILFAHQGRLTQVAATHHKSQLFGDHHIMIGRILPTPHRMNTRIQGAQRRPAQDLHVFARHRHHISIIIQLDHRLLSLRDPPALVDAYYVPVLFQYP